MLEFATAVLTLAAAVLGFYAAMIAARRKR